ncbi:hypothetical protein FNV43_RR24558 [Rhamnella rubrinervis]|uniref:Uncharacterized protein n=1 Tax=Rhamnella rubrinervis TaxID=2594499 RepID=A0A8K0DRF0_9ROSA|nr:hypothetical protein FNV43_RR24558 [Rhamnella rubrinervis]
MVQGEPSHRRTAHTPASSSRVKYKEIRGSEDALQQELERKKLEVAKFFSGFTIVVPLLDKQVWYHDPGEQAALNDHLNHIGVEIPCVVETCLEEEEDPEEKEDLKKEDDPEEEEEDPEEFPTDV